MRCPNCNHVIPTYSIYCGYCRYQIAEHKGKPPGTKPPKPKGEQPEPKRQKRKKKSVWVKVILVVVVLLLTVVLIGVSIRSCVSRAQNCGNVSSSMQSRILGTWQHSEPYYLVFSNNCQLVYYNEKGNWVKAFGGKYRWLDESLLKITWSATYFPDFDNVSPGFRLQSGEYTVMFRENKMDLAQVGQPAKTFVRVK